MSQSPLSRRPLAPALLVLLALSGVSLSGLSLAGCATFEEVEGVPDGRAYSYFFGTPADVAGAARRVLTLEGYTVEGVDERPGGVTIIRVTTDPPSADFDEIRIEPAPTNERDYRARAQTSPRRRRLPLELERRISAEL